MEYDLNHPCGGHSCQKYANPQVLYDEIMAVSKRMGEEALPYDIFLLKLGIRPSTPGHGQTCRPKNMKLLEYVKVGAERSIFQAIKGNPNLVMKYGELTKDKTEEQPKSKVTKVTELLKQEGKDETEF